MSTAVAEPTTPVARRGWYRRNWKWVTPLLVLLVVVGGGLIYFWPIITPRFHPQYAATLAEIRKNPKAIELLGEPIEPVRLFPAGIISNESGGQAVFYFDVHGPKLEPNQPAGITSKSRMHHGEWSLTAVVLKLKSDQPAVDLMKSSQQPVNDDTPPFDPYAKQPEMPKPNLPRNIETGPMNIDIELPPGASQ
jgi:hypothetical protein